MNCILVCDRTWNLCFRIIQCRILLIVCFGTRCLLRHVPDRCSVWLLGDIWLIGLILLLFQLYLPLLRPLSKSFHTSLYRMSLRSCATPPFGIAQIIYWVLLNAIFFQQLFLIFNIFRSTLQVFGAVIIKKVFS